MQKRSKACLAFDRWRFSAYLPCSWPSLFQRKLRASSGPRLNSTRHRLSIYLCCLFASWLHMGTAYGQAQTKPLSPEAQKADTAEPQAIIGEQNGSAFATPKISADPYAGIVVNQTITVAGHDFFQYFIAAWRDKDLVDKYEIAINERPSARLGTQIWINYRQRRVFQVFLPASRAAIRPVSVMAADSVYEAVVQTDVQQLLFKDPDLAPDEF